MNSKQTPSLCSLVVFKRGNRDNKPQSREEPGRETTEKPPARIAGIFCQSSIRWRTDHFHWIRRQTRHSQFPKGLLHGTAMITMKIFGTQVGNRFCIYFANIMKLLTAKHEQDTVVNSFARRRDAMAVFLTGVCKSMIFTVFYFFRSPGKNCRL